MSEDSLKIGNAVRLIDGPLRGRHGYIVSEGSEGALQVLITGGHRWPVPLSVSDAQVEDLQARRSMKGSA